MSRRHRPFNHFRHVTRHNTIAGAWRCVGLGYCSQTPVVLVYTSKLTYKISYKKILSVLCTHSRPARAKRTLFSAKSARTLAHFIM